MKKLAARSTQRVQSMEFVFQHNNWVIDSADGVKKTFGSTVALSTDPSETGLTGPVANTVTFDALPLPVGAVIVGGEVVTETPVAGSTAATLSVGIAGSTTALVNATSIMAAAGTRVAFTQTTTQLLANSGQNLRLTMAYTVANATAGKVRVRVEFTVDGRSDEVQIA